MSESVTTVPIMVQRLYYWRHRNKDRAFKLSDANRRLETSHYIIWIPKREGGHVP